MRSHDSSWVPASIVLGFCGLLMGWFIYKEPPPRYYPSNPVVYELVREATDAWTFLDTIPREYQAPYAGQAWQLTQQLVDATQNGSTLAEAQQLLEQLLDADARAQSMPVEYAGATKTAARAATALVGDIHAQYIVDRSR